MARYFDTLPAILDCCVCRCLLPIGKFAKTRTTSPMAQAGGARQYTVAEICYTCKGLYRRHQLTPAQRRRYEELRAQARDAHNELRRSARQTASTAAGRVPKGPAPYDIAVEQLEQEWNKPVGQWTLRDDYRCTERIYRLLGWPVEELAKDSRMARDAKDNRIRERRATATATATAAEDDADA